MAYRKAEQERWKSFDFVLGYEVKITQNGKHVEDICDCLKGKYRKDFKFMGWHPMCMCYTIPILKTEDEFFDDDEGAKSVNEVEDVPQGFKDWVKDNEERIDKAAERGKLPYFIADNKRVVENILKGGSGTNKNSKDDAEVARIEANRREYERLKADPNYTDVKFNPKNGGLKATHVEHETHNNDKTLYFGKFKPNDLELMAQNILYNNGYSCILESEMIFNSQGIQQVSLDTTTNSERMDIKSITKNGKNTLKNAIRDKKAQLTKFNENNNTDYHSLILYFYDKEMFDEQSVRKLLGKTFQRFICAIEPNTIKIIE